MRRLMLAGACTVFLLGEAGQAPAATTVGQTFPPRPDILCPAGGTVLQKTSPTGTSYAAPSAGVITAWSHFQNGSPVALKLQVARLVAANTYRIVGASPLVAPAMAQLNTYTDVRISVQPGDVIGLYMATGGSCMQFDPNPPTVGAFHEGGEILPGADAVFTDRVGHFYDVSARLEADGDSDGFGDETQDDCPTDATRQATPCAEAEDTDAPETTITKHPPKRLDGGTARFKFTADEAGASFQCKVDRKPYKPCTSPKVVKRLDDGWHKFKVRAIDAAGSIDPTPAKNRFRVLD